MKTAPQGVPLLTMREVERLTKIKRSRIYQLLGDGTFPAQVRLPSGGVRWRLVEVDAWLNGTWDADAARTTTKPKGGPRGKTLEERRRAAMLTAARSHASRSHLDFALTRADLDRMWPAEDCCPVFGRPFDYERARHPDAPVLDRFDEEHGYTPENCAVICRRANQLKHDSTPVEIFALHNWMMETMKYLF